MNQDYKGFSPILRAVIITFIVLIAICAIGLTIALQSITLILWWIPITISAVLSLMVSTVLWKIWRRVTESGSFTVNFIISIVFFTFILTGSFYSLNSFFSHSEKIKEEVTVTSKYREKHYRSQRVGRNRYVKGPAYYEYYITVKFQDGSTKNIQLPWKDYEGIKKDSELTLSLRKGLLGSNVIITNDITIDNPRASEKRKRCRFFGTHDKKDSLKYNQRFPSRKDSK